MGNGWNRTHFDSHRSLVVLVILGRRLYIPSRLQIGSPLLFSYLTKAMVLFLKTLDHGLFSIYSIGEKQVATPNQVAVSKTLTLK